MKYIIFIAVLFFSISCGTIPTSVDVNYKDSKGNDYHALYNDDSTTKTCAVSVDYKDKTYACQVDYKDSAPDAMS